jgi:citrate lyase subunit beta/citryl-CoA lyase
LKPLRNRRASAQLPIIERAYLPTADEVERAQATVARLGAAGAGPLGGGEFVDAAMLGAARQIVEIAARYGT